MYFKDRISYVVQAGLELNKLSASACQELELQNSGTTVSLNTGISKPIIYS